MKTTPPPDSERDTAAPICAPLADTTAPLPPPPLKMGARVSVKPEGYPDFVYEGVLASDDDGGPTLDIQHLGKVSRERVRSR